MKKITLSLLIVAICSCAFQPEKGKTIKSYYPSGKLRSITEVENGKKNGKEELYFDNGNLFMVQFFKDDMLVDSVYQYEKSRPNKLLFKGHSSFRSRLVVQYLNNQVFAITDFKENLVADGIVQTYHSNGRIMSNSIFKDGKKDGVEVDYDFKGNVRRVKHYKAGVQVPPIIEFDSTGKLIRHIPAVE